MCGLKLMASGSVKCSMMWMSASSSSIPSSLKQKQHVKRSNWFRLQQFSSRMNARAFSRSSLTARFIGVVCGVELFIPVVSLESRSSSDASSSINSTSSFVSSDKSILRLLEDLRGLPLLHPPRPREPPRNAPGAEWFPPAFSDWLWLWVLILLWIWLWIWFWLWLWIWLWLWLGPCLWIWKVLKSMRINPRDRSPRYLGSDERNNGIVSWLLTDGRWSNE